jgi:hypothetical protein
LHAQLNFPASANGGPDRGAYWLTGAERLVIDVQVGIGPGEVSAPDQLTGVLLLDGKQVPVLIDEAPPATHWQRTLAAVGRVDRFTLEVPGQHVRPGAQRADLVFWRRGGRPFPSLSFMVMKDGSRLSQRRQSGAFVRLPVAARATLAVVERAAGIPLMRDFQPAGPRLPLRLLAERPTGDGLASEVGVAFVGFLDGRQIPLGSLGQRPQLRLGSRERVAADFDLPLGKGNHPHRTLVLFALVTDGPVSSGDGTLPAGPLPARPIGWAHLGPRN